MSVIAVRAIGGVDWRTRDRPAPVSGVLSTGLGSGPVIGTIGVVQTAAT